MFDSKKILTIILVVAGLYLIALGASYLLEEDGASFEDQIAIIPIEGAITIGQSTGFGAARGANTDTIVNFIEEANRNKKVKGIVLEINSPGGTVIASKEIAEAVKKTEKPVVAVIREVGASGAYWIASSADYIIADELSITGSIGVIGSYLEFSELFDEYGIKYQQLTGGEYKDTGTPFRSLTNEEERILQKKIDLIHEAFIKTVQENRGLTEEEARNAGTGIFYLGSEALELGLIDELGNKDRAIEKVKELAEAPDAEVVSLKEETTIFDLFTGVSAYHFGRGFAKGMQEIGVEDKFSIKAI